MLLQCVGTTAYYAEQFRTARAAFEAMRVVGLELNHGRITADAYHFLGRVITDANVTITPSGSLLPFRRVRPGCAGELRIAIQCFEEAARHEPAHDAVGLAHDWRQQAKLWRLLGEQERARAAEAEARDCFGDSPAVANLLLDWGRDAVISSTDETRRERRAEELLRTGIEHCITISWWMLLSRTLAALGDVYALRDHEAALDCTLAAMLAWPGVPSAREYRRMASLFGDLVESSDRSPEAIQARADLRRWPFDAVYAVAPFGPRTVAEVVRPAVERQGR